MQLSVKMPLVIRTTRFIIAWGKGDYNTYADKKKKTDRISPIFNLFCYNELYGE